MALTFSLSLNNFARLIGLSFVYRIVCLKLGHLEGYLSIMQTVALPLELRRKLILRGARAGTSVLDRWYVIYSF